MEKPNFESLEKQEIEQFKTEIKYTLIPVRDIESNDSMIESIYSVCNEEEVYKWLFDPNEYTLEKAKGFLDWGKTGWDKLKYFVFLVLDSSNSVVGAIDIKSNNLEEGEIGYWFSQHHRGLATNTVKVLSHIAKKAGYKKLYAQTKEGNEKSSNVLKRANFVENKFYNKDSNCAHGFVLDL